MTYRLIATEAAESDRDNSFRYIAERSPAGALRWLDAYQSAIHSLANNPLSGLSPESENHEEEIRQVLFKTPKGLTYRALFIVRGDAVYILHVRGPGQNVMGSAEIVLPEE